MLLIFRLSPYSHYAFICWGCSVLCAVGKISIIFKSLGSEGYPQGLLGMVPSLLLDPELVLSRM